MRLYRILLPSPSCWGPKNIELTIKHWFGKWQCVLARVILPGQVYDSGLEISSVNEVVLKARWDHTSVRTRWRSHTSDQKVKQLSI